MTKLFCVLEQGKYVGEDNTAAKKELFTTPYSDFVRLNWHTDDDPLADLYRANICWSEGRSLLFEHTRGKYQYYLFTDDDIVFHAAGHDSAAAIIAQWLEQERPVSGTLWSEDSWEVGHMPRLMGAQLDRPSFPIAAHDLQTQLFSAPFADLMLPVIHHGSECCLWYAQWLAYRLFPRKQTCLTRVRVSNKRHDLHADRTLAQFHEARKLLGRFYQDVTDPTDAYLTRFDGLRNTLQVIHDPPDTREVTPTRDDLAAVLDVSAPAYAGRRPLAAELDAEALGPETPRDPHGLFRSRELTRARRSAERCLLRNPTEPRLWVDLAKLVVKAGLRPYRKYSV